MTHNANMAVDFFRTFIVYVVIAFILPPPKVLARRFFAKFEVHSKLSDEHTVVTINGNQMEEEDEDKSQFINHFSKAILIDCYYQIPAKYTGTPFVVKTEQHKNNIMLFVYLYDAHVDVFKQLKKKGVSYRPFSGIFQIHSMLEQRTFVEA